MAINHQPLSPALGGEVTGIDIKSDLDGPAFNELWRLFVEYQVLVIRSQNLSGNDLIEFSQRCGEIIRHPVTDFLLPNHPDIMIVSNVIENGRPIGTADAGRYWHSDMTYVAEPPKCTILYAVEIPEGFGDTLFSNMYAAFEALSPELQNKLLKLKAIHEFSNAGKGRGSLSEEMKAKTPPMMHPVVRTHPESKRKALFVHENNVVALADNDDPELLRSLYDHSVRDEFVYRHKWQPGDVVVWDNRCTMHKAIKDYSWPDQRRIMYRTMIAGDRPRL